MTVSTKGRYALRVMVDLAEHASGDFIPLRAVAERQNISQKYLEAIMSFQRRVLLRVRTVRAAATVFAAPPKNTACVKFWRLPRAI